MNSYAPLRFLLNVPLGAINYLLHDTEVVVGYQSGACRQSGRVLEERVAGITGCYEELAREGIKLCQTASLQTRSV